MFFIDPNTYCNSSLVAGPPIALSKDLFPLTLCMCVCVLSLLLNWRSKLRRYLAKKLKDEAKQLDEDIK